MRKAKHAHHHMWREKATEHAGDGQIIVRDDCSICGAVRIRFSDVHQTAAVRVHNPNARISLHPLADAYRVAMYASARAPYVDRCWFAAIQRIDRRVPVIIPTWAQAIDRDDLAK